MSAQIQKADAKGRSTRKRNLVALFVMTALLVGIAIAIPQRQLLPPQFCSVCLLRQDRVEWRLPFEGPVFFERHHEWPTPVNSLLAEKRFFGPHEHCWQGALAMTNPLEPGAPAVVQSLEFVNAPRVVSFLRDLLTYADAESAARWKEITLSLENSTLMDDALRFCRFPVDGFPNQLAFMAWWSRGGARSVAHRLQQQKDPD